jgi:hypothetical protein
VKQKPGLGEGRGGGVSIIPMKEEEVKRTGVVAETGIILLTSCGDATFTKYTHRDVECVGEVVD